MKNYSITIGLFLCLISFVHAGIPFPRLLNDSGQLCSPAKFSLKQGSALCIIKAFPGAMETAARTIEQLPARFFLQSKPKIYLVLAGTSLRKSRLWIAKQRFHKPWLCEPKNVLLKKLSISSLPTWIFLNEAGEISARSSLLSIKDLRQLLHSHSQTIKRRRNKRK